MDLQPGLLCLDYEKGIQIFLSKFLGTLGLIELFKGSLNKIYKNQNVNFFLIGLDPPPLKCILQRKNLKKILAFFFGFYYFVCLLYSKVLCDVPKNSQAKKTEILDLSKI